MNAPSKPHPEAPRVSEAPLTLLQRLHAVMQEVSYVQKDKEITSYKVVTHDKVTKAVRPALVKHGVFYYPHSIARQQNGKLTEIDMTVRFVSVDDAADHLDVPTCGYGLDTGDKGPGKAMSYAVKYALLKALGLETGEDADNDASPDVPDREPNGETVPKGPRGGTDKTPPADEELKLYGYPTPDGHETLRYQRTSTDVARWVDDMEHVFKHNPGAWDTNSNMLDIVLVGIEAMEKRGDPKGHALRQRLADMESLAGDAKYLQAG